MPVAAKQAALVNGERLDDAARRRRTAELAMLVFAVGVVLAAEAIVETTQEGRVNAHLATYGLVPLAAGFIAHLIVRRFAPYADPLILPCVVFLNGLGLVMIRRLDVGEMMQARERGLDYGGDAAPSQVLWTAFGLIGFLALLAIVRDHRVLQRYAYTLALVGLFFLALPAVLPARFSEVNGARIWIRIAGFSIQPGEMAKILLTIFGAAYLVAKRDVLSLAGRRFIGLEFPRGRDLGPLLLAWLLCIGVLIRGHDLGTSLMFFGLFVVLLYIATERASWVVLGLILFSGGAFLAYHLFANVQVRVSVWLHVFDDANNTGYQVSQSLFGLGTGGLFGAGLGGGHPEIVPLPATDFIITSFGEELGLFGLVAVLCVFGLLIARGFSAALAVRDSFGKLLTAGLSFSLALQLFVVVAGVSRLLPETGLTTPFLSYGGSSLVANYVLVALLLRVSDSARRPAVATPVAASSPSLPPVLPVTPVTKGGAS